MKIKILLLALVLSALSIASYAIYAPGNAPFINTWLINGPYDNDANDTGFKTDFINENSVAPKLGDVSGKYKWEYFDDRLFSRNYDDYIDLFSYYTIKKNIKNKAFTAYAHVWVYSDKAQKAQLRVGADSRYKVWFNNKQIIENKVTNAYKDDSIENIYINKGWNSILIKLANLDETFFGLFARITDEKGNEIKGLTYSVNGAGNFEISTQNMTIDKKALPDAYREWPYVKFYNYGFEEMKKLWPDASKKARPSVQASSFVLNASGGTAPYKWKLSKGKLPLGLSIKENGEILGVVSEDAKLGDYKFKVSCVDATGKTVNKDFSMLLKERPNKWPEEGRLTALVHAPEEIPAKQYDEFNKLIERQGYGLIFPISMNNGELKFRFKSRFQPNPELGNVIEPYKKSLEKTNIKFGMYLGNIHTMPQYNYTQSILVIEDVIDQFNPKALWFDWSGYKHPSVDALYSMIRTKNPDLVIFLNGADYPYNGDWDILCIEDFSYGDYSKIWGTWPGETHMDRYPDIYKWGKKNTLETWRLMMNTSNHKYGYEIPGLTDNKENPDWKNILRLQISLIGEGWIANMDHSMAAGWIPKGQIKDIYESPSTVAHKNMADWANPKGLEPLYKSYTQCNIFPNDKYPWGYTTISLPKDIIYLHFIKNPRGKTGIPANKTAEINKVTSLVKNVICMNTGKPVEFVQNGSKIILNLSNVNQDEIDTIIKISLKTPIKEKLDYNPYPNIDYNFKSINKKGNLAYKKPSLLLGLGGNELEGSGYSYASKGVDGIMDSVAQGAWEYAWAYEVDLEKIETISRINVYMGEKGYATHYILAASVDGKNWTTIKEDKDNHRGGEFIFKFTPTKARFIKISSITPNGENQEGGQMSIRELEVYK